MKLTPHEKMRHLTERRIAALSEAGSAWSAARAESAEWSVARQSQADKLRIYFPSIEVSK